MLRDANLHVPEKQEHVLLLQVVRGRGQNSSSVSHNGPGSARDAPCAPAHTPVHQGCRVVGQAGDEGAILMKGVVFGGCSKQRM